MSFVKYILNRASLDQVQISDIFRLIENKTEESLHLDYESIPEKHVKYEGLAEHISGFLNTSGGIIVFGVAEKKENGRIIPDHITWTTIKKETVENNLYQRVDPWHEDIRILPFSNPKNDIERIFLIYVPKSKNSPHMANYRYYMRLNFQTKPMGHNQVLSIFRQSYIQRQELINVVYGPLYNELASFYTKKWINTWTLSKYNRILREGRFLLSQDVDFALELEKFYNRIANWNKAIEASRFRLPKIINRVASSFFKKKIHYAPDHSAIRINVKAESIHQIINIDQAVLNNTDPIALWKLDNPFARILEVKIELELCDEERRRDSKISVIEEKEFQEFLKKLNLEIQKDNLITYIRREFKEMQAHIENVLFEELAHRM